VVDAIHNDASAGFKPGFQDSNPDKTDYHEWMRHLDKPPVMDQTRRFTGFLIGGYS